MTPVFVFFMLAFVQGASAARLGKSVCQDMWIKAVNNLNIGTELLVNAGQTVFQIADIQTSREKVNGYEFRWFTSLLTKYVWNHQKTAINPTADEQDFNSARENFLEAITQPGGPIEEAFKYLRKRGLLPYIPNLEHFRRKLQVIWFGSGGFQHTFVGDKKVANWGYSGFHNWLQFVLEQQAGRIQIQNHQQQQQQQEHFHSHTEPPFMQTVPFEWNGHTKYQGASTTMFVGTSPAFEIALYTVCFLEHPGQPCKCHIGRSTVTVQTHAVLNVGGTGDKISTAFPRKVEIEDWRRHVDPDYRTKCACNHMTQHQCESKGCYYDNTYPDAKKCFYPCDHKCDVFDPRDRTACYGGLLTRDHCEKHNNCCYDDTVSGAPFCFKGNP